MPHYYCIQNSSVASPSPNPANTFQCVPPSFPSYCGTQEPKEKEEQIGFFLCVETHFILLTEVRGLPELGWWSKMFWFEEALLSRRAVWRQRQSHRKTICIDCDSLERMSHPGISSLSRESFPFRVRAQMWLRKGKMDFCGKSVNSARTQWMQVYVWHPLPLPWVTSRSIGGENVAVGSED